jgi:membrane protein
MKRKRHTQPFWPLAAYAALTVAASYLGRRIGKTRQTASEPASAAFGKEPKRKPADVDFQRAMQSDRGRDAVSPFDIPFAGWKDIAWRTYQQIDEDRLLAIAGGVVFFGLLAIFPALAAFVSLYGLFADAGTISKHIDLATGILPATTLDIFREQIGRIVTSANSTLGFAFILSLGLALWSANAGMKAVIDALNVIYGEKEKRSFVKLTLVAFAFTIGIIVFMLLAIAGVIVLPIVLNTIGLGAFSETLMRISRWPALLLVIVLGLACLYRYGPSRLGARWQWLSVGAVLAAVIWLVASILLSWYLEKFADYNATYGSLGAGVGLMMWMWVSAIAILLGAEINAEMEHQTARDSTVGREKPLGARGAAMADTVGQSASSAPPIPADVQVGALIGEVLGDWVAGKRQTQKRRRRAAKRRR